MRRSAPLTSGQTAEAPRSSKAVGEHKPRQANGHPRPISRLEHRTTTLSLGNEGMRGDLMALVLAGVVAPMQKKDEGAAFAGRVLFGDDGAVVDVTARGEASPTGFDGAPRVGVGNAVIYPGLVDLHSHLGYNTLPLWSDPARTTPYAHHDSWPGEDGYPQLVSWPAWTLLERVPECVLAYVQVRALAGG